MGTLMVPLPYLLRAQLGRVGRVRRGAAAGVRPDVPVLLALRARGHLHRCDHARAAGRRLPLPGPPAAPSAGADRRAARAELRHQGVDVHHRVRRRHVLLRRARCAAARTAARAGARGRPRRLGLGPGRVRRRLHDPLHDLPHPPRRALGRDLHGPGVLARPARRRPRRRVEDLLRRRPVRGRVAGAAARRGRRRRGAAPSDAAARVPRVGVRALARDLLVGGREVRLARPAPAAAAAAAGRDRRAGDLGDAPDAGTGRSASRPRRRRSRTPATPRSSSTPCTAPTRASCWSPPSPRRRSRASPTSVVAQAERAERAGQPFTITVDAAEGATFPWAWYFRDLGVALRRPRQPGTTRRTATC